MIENTESEQVERLNTRVSELLRFNNEFEQRARDAERAIKALTTPRPIEEYHEDMGDVLWWALETVKCTRCDGDGSVNTHCNLP